MSSCAEVNPEEKAEEMGLAVVYPKQDEIQLDIDDGKAGLRHLAQCLEILDNEGIELIEVSRTTSKSGGLHITLRRHGHAFTALERVALQACIGSDRLRELYSYVHLANKTLENPTLFYEVKPDHKATIIELDQRVNSSYYSEKVKISESYKKELTGPFGPGTNGDWDR